MRTIRTTFAILICCAVWACTSGSAEGVKVLGEVRGTGAPVFKIPGEDRMLLVFVSQQDTLYANELRSMVYGGRSLKLLDRNRSRDSVSGISSLEVWYLEEEALGGTDSSDLEFFFEFGDPVERGQTFHTASILLQNVNQQRVVSNLVKSNAAAPTRTGEESSGEGSVLLTAVFAPEDSPLDNREGFTEIYHSKAGGQRPELRVYARFLATDGPFLAPSVPEDTEGDWRYMSISVEPARKP